MVKRLNFFLSYNKYFSSETFFVFVKSYSISPACHGKRLVPAGFFFFSSLLITYFRTLSLEKVIIVFEKVRRKS